MMSECKYGQNGRHAWAIFATDAGEIEIRCNYMECPAKMPQDEAEFILNSYTAIEAELEDEIKKLRNDNDKLRLAQQIMK